MLKCLCERLTGGVMLMSSMCIQVVYQRMMESGEGDIEEFKKVRFFPNQWKDLPTTIHQGNETTERDRCIAVLKAYEIMVNIKGMDYKKYRKDIYEEVNRFINPDVLKEIKQKLKKAKQGKPAEGQSSQKSQQSGNKKKGKNKK